MKKRILAIGVILLIGAMLTGCGDSVATVNGEKLTQSQLDKIVNLYVAQAQATYNTDPRKDPEFMKDIEEAALESLIDQTLLVQEASKQGIEATDKEVNEAITNFKKSAGTDGYKNFLKASGMTDEDFEKEMHNQVLIDELHEKVVAPVKVSSKEAKKYYDEHPEDFGNPYQLRVSHILLDTKAEADKVIERVKAGEDFSKLAKELSTESAAKTTGGDLGFISEESNLVPEFKTPALKLKPGQITEEPVKSQFGFHVIKAFEEKAAKVEPYEEQKDQALVLAKQAKEEKAWQDLVAKLRKEATIKKAGK